MAFVPIAVCADEASDSRRHGRLCLAAMEVDNFKHADFWCVRAAEDWAAMAGALPPGNLHDTARLAEAFYLGRVALANRTLDRVRTERFIDKTTAVFAELIHRGATTEIKKAAQRNYVSWVREMQRS